MEIDQPRLRTATLISTLSVSHKSFMVYGCIPARSDERSSRYSPELADLITAEISYRVQFFHPFLEREVCTIVWWRFPNQRAGGTVSRGV